jgi:hypothetical protein
MQCKQAGIPVFVKQLGTRASDPKNGIAGSGPKIDPDVLALVSRRLSGKGNNMSEWPADLQVREWPR